MIIHYHSFSHTRYLIELPCLRFMRFFASLKMTGPLTRLFYRNPRGSPSSPSFGNSSTASGPPGSPSFENSSTASGPPGSPSFQRGSTTKSGGSWKRGGVGVRQSREGVYLHYARPVAKRLAIGRFVDYCHKSPHSPRRPPPSCSPLEVSTVFVPSIFNEAASICAASIFTSVIRGDTYVFFIFLYWPPPSPPIGESLEDLI